MKSTSRTLLAAVVPFLLLAGTSVSADDDPAGTQLTGQFMLGYRTVSVDGHANKYDEDYNLHKGPRLFNLNLVFQPDESSRGFADRVQLDVANYGGDPYESLHLGIEKHGTYNFQYTRTKDTYFYEDIILPEALANARLENAGDERTFDYEHVRDFGKLDLSVSKAAKLHFNFDRFTRLGTSTQPIDLVRDSYLLTKPVDESQNRYGVGFDYAWSKATLSLSENVRDYTNAVSLFLPGASRGVVETGKDMIDFYFFDQPYNYKSYDHTARLIVHPNTRWTLKTSALLQRLDMDLDANLRQEGLDQNGNPLSPTEATGSGSISRDNDIFDVETTYMFNDQVGVLAGAWHKKSKQDGSFTYDDALSRGNWDLKTNGGRAGVELDFVSGVTVTAGLQYEKREVARSDTADGDLEERPTVTTKDTGIFANLGWTPNARFHLTAEVENSSVTDPYTLVAPTDRQRVRVRAQYRSEEGFYVSGSFLVNKFKNNDSGWDAHYNQANLRVGYQAKNVTASVGYNRIDIQRNVDQSVDVADTTTLLYLVPIAYDAKTDFLDGNVRWAPDEHWGVGANLRHYTNNGSWGLTNDDLGGYLEYTFVGNYLVHAGYRHVKYNEDMVNFDDYSANIGEFSIGYRW
jgi:hypothetical protein